MVLLRRTCFVSRIAVLLLVVGCVFNRPPRRESPKGLFLAANTQVVRHDLVVRVYGDDG
jgi:hypothetical protein